MKEEAEASLTSNQTTPGRTQNGSSLLQDLPRTPTMSGISPTLSFSSTSSSSSLPFLTSFSSSTYPVKPLDKVTDLHDSSSNTGSDIGATKVLEKKKEAEISKLNPPQDIRPFLERCKIKSDGDKLPESGVAFRRAAAAGLEAITRALAENDKTLDINQAGTESGKTALHFAVLQGRTNVVSQLIRMEARSDIRDAQGNTVSDYATKSTNEGIKKLFAINN